ncbi:MAG: bifunctional phosphoribosylaminoimidazolecarboxamide formyltransferase/IMP cyclohydrolase [Dehalococcoidia bacterium]|nr:bifunctional phosphoribosylaminoimidazolecarboxamide formyltransferase/IMP cyclohydrolase [Dehalococcoidia bacterium]
MRALLSVYDKIGLVEFARKLVDAGVELVSTGGTHAALAQAGLSVRQVSDVTGSPEILDGRVKTLHPAIHGGLLARRDVPAHVAELQRQGIATIDLVAVNLYPFEATVGKPGVTLDDALENIDIGGPTMLRSAAKNFPSVTVVCDPEDYDRVAEQLRSGGPSLEERRKLAAKAFQHVAFYDTIVAGYLRGDDAVEFPEELTLAYRRVQPLRYGENPHQKGAFYAEPRVVYSSLALGARVLGQDLSLCNVNDLSAALETVREFLDRPAAVVIKHATPSGFAFGATLDEALEKAIHADATSAFGGIIGLNRPLDMATARVVERFKDQESSNIDAIVAPGASEEVLSLLRHTRRRMVVYTVPDLQPLPKQSINLKHVPGGLLYQEANVRPIRSQEWKVVSKATPTPQQLRAMQDAWGLLRHIRSNTILVWDGVKGVTLGIGSGQVSRVGAAKLALEQAGERARGTVLASDSFFPFPDSVELAARAGIAAIVQQGGSINDKASIDAADAADMVMVLTGERAFWH